MKILIIGSGGRLGAALARAWADQHEVLALGRAELDLTQQRSIREVLGNLSFDVLVNCAALTDVDYCEAHEEQAVQVNAKSVETMGEISSAMGARMIQISTDYVFDGCKRTPYSEEDPVNPIGAYARSKQLGEQLLLGVSPQHLVVRVSWVFGPDRPSFIDALVRRALESESVEAIADKWSAPTYTLDAAAALEPLLHSQAAAGYLHICNAGECTWQQYGQHALDCAASAGLPLRATKVAPLKLSQMQRFVAPRPVYTVLSTSKLEQITGRAPRNWQLAVEEYVSGYLAPGLKAAQ